MAANPPERMISSPPIPISDPALNQPQLGQAMLEERQVRHHVVVLTSFGVIAIIAALFTTIIDWTVLAWRTTWLVICLFGFVGLLSSVANLFNFSATKTKSSTGEDLPPVSK
jgi:hypothetical protein